MPTRLEIYDSGSASPIITDIVDDAVFEKLRAAGLAETDAFHVMCAIAGNRNVFVTVDTKDILPMRAAVEASCPQILIRRPTELLKTCVRQV